MSSKIDWYREVLALEPGSRVFFPLAQLLRQAGRVDEAVAALRGGLAFHPEHLEAKFLLVELLAGPNSPAGLAAQTPELAETFDSLIGVLTRYPAFWNLWSEKIAASSRDCALAVNMLAAHLRGAQVDFAGLMEKGLRAADSFPAVAAPAALLHAAARKDASSKSTSPAPIQKDSTSDPKSLEHKPLEQWSRELGPLTRNRRTVLDADPQHHDRSPTFFRGGP